MELSDLLLWLHIVGAGTWLGANMVQLAAQRVRKSDTVEAAWSRIAADLGTSLYMPAGILVLLSGVGLVLSSSVYGFGSRFVTVGILVVIVGAALGPTVFGPGGHQLADALEAGDTKQAVRLQTRLFRFALLDTALVLVAIAVMVLRWV